MKKNKKEFIDWVKAHKKQLFIAGVSVTTIIIGFKNKESIEELWDFLKNTLNRTPRNLPETSTRVQIAPSAIEEGIPNKVYTSSSNPFTVSQHIRNLPAGRHHSDEKAAEAKALRIDLLSNQTLVNAYTKCAA